LSDQYGRSALEIELRDVRSAITERFHCRRVLWVDQMYLVIVLPANSRATTLIGTHLCQIKAKNLFPMHVVVSAFGRTHFDGMRMWICTSLRETGC
jgi:hypothetical protein